MRAIKDLIKRILPKSLLKKIRPLGHGFLAYYSAWKNGYPSRKLIVIGITGTAGKSSTIQMLSTVLNYSGHKAGYITTVASFDGDQKDVNKQGMSMPAGSVLQKHLVKLIQNGCKYAVIECTSEGLAQNRHLGIDFDIALLTNLSPAHLEAHGGFENYKKAKGRLFKTLRTSFRKPFFKRKVIGLVLPNSYANYFLSFDADKQFIVRMSEPGSGVLPGQINQRGIKEYLVIANGPGAFEMSGQNFKLNLSGEFNIRNAALAAATADMLGVPLSESARALETITEIAGRMQLIPNSRDLNIYLDYAPEPVAMENALRSVSNIPHRSIIHVFGSTGGHRDVQKRFEFGKISARYADTVVVTNDDVYDSDPQKIADDVVSGIRKSDAVPHVHVVLDRRSAIRKALELAQPGDIIIFTGKGSEQFLVLPGDRRIDWDEKTEIENALKEL